MPQAVLNLRNTSQTVVTAPKKTSGSLWWRNIIVVIVSIVVTAVGIKAADKLGNTGPVSPCPEGMVQVLLAKGNVCIDQFEASASSDCPNVNPITQQEVQENLDVNSCTPISVKANMPWRNISQNQASIACARAGKRLPTNEEWQAAALGTPDKSSGWGESDCNVARNWSGQLGATGTGENCKSAIGAYDMVGNVWEWVMETATDGVVRGKTLPAQGYVKSVDDMGLPSETSVESDPQYYGDYLFMKNIGTKAVARGGYWGNQSQAGIYAVHIVSEPRAAEDGMGFRCVK